jgi:DNA helicase-2/ATP-dependent DNA helicase PcrA
LSRLFDEEKKLPQPNQPYNGEEADMAARPAQLQYRTGQKVSHARFGEGIVIESKATGSDEEVTVAFSGVGIKKLAASLARLEVREG